MRGLTNKLNKMEAKEILDKHLKLKNLTNEHIHIAAYMSCLDAINEALNMHFISNNG